MKLTDLGDLGGVGGERIQIKGKVLDGAGDFVEDALVEIWQADATGRYPQPGDSAGFTGFGRSPTDFASGEFRFETIKPGRVADPEGELQAPHLIVVVQARGMLRPLFTRLYFADEETANETDLVLGLVPPERRSTLIARWQADEDVYQFDIRLQGEDETVFFTY